MHKRSFPAKKSACISIEKTSTISGRGLCWRYLFSQPVARQLSSAQMSLTSVFGMGTGGPSSQSTPTIFRFRGSSSLLGELLYYTALSSFVKRCFCASSLPTSNPVKQSRAEAMRSVMASFRARSKRGICSLRRAGDPYRIRTDVNGVRGHCLNHLTNGPFPCVFYLQRRFQR